MQLAELNIAKLKVPEGSPSVQEFFDALDQINALAERSDGFIWRMQSDKGNATDIVYSDDPKVIANLSVWRDHDSLKRYVFETVHKDFFARRMNWFEKSESAHFCMWLVEEGAQPSLVEAKARLDYLNRHGDSDYAFGWQWWLKNGDPKVFNL